MEVNKHGLKKFSGLIALKKDAVGNPVEKLQAVCADKEALVAKALSLVTAEIQQALETKDLCTLVLAGGSTPQPLYEAIASLNLPWEKLHIFWGDERYVSPDHPDSNEGMARRAWLDQVAMPGENIHAMPTGAGNPEQDAASYADHLRTWFHLSAGEFPSFDLVLLGMGDDGHTASLFPHTKALQVCDRLVTVGDKDGQPRLTLTIPVLNQAHCVLFLVSGAGKQSALEQVFAPMGDAFTYPARFIRPQGRLIWLLDQAAAANLNL